MPRSSRRRIGYCCTTFPAQAATLNAYRTEALAAVSDGSIPDGVQVGATAAAAMIELSSADGRQPIGAVATIDDPLCAPGGYRRTPAGSWTLGPQTPWLGQVTPFLLRKAGQFHPPAPSPLTSQLWVDQVEEDRDWGARTAPIAVANRRLPRDSGPPT